jgi:uncharacterized repeat protein (TIGR02543 family)
MHYFTAAPRFLPRRLLVTTHELTLLPGGGCATPHIDAYTLLFGEVEATGPSACWTRNVCQLTVLTDTGGTVQNSSTSGAYACTDCVVLTAWLNTGYQFDYWSGDASGEGPVATVCLYGNDKTVTAHFSQIPPPDPPPLGDPGPQCGDTGWVGQCSPIVINFEAGPYRLTGANSPVFFDIGDTGTPVRIGWTLGSADESFLWRDLNLNGKVDTGAELFGTATRLKNGARAPNGFEALKEYDDNGDGVIDSHDSIWPQLRLWRDLNHNGSSEPNEISSILDSRVTAITIPYHWTGIHDTYGNQFRYGSTVRIRNSRFASFARPLYDVFFVPVH